jgi:hypothetical protein
MYLTITDPKKASSKVEAIMIRLRTCEWEAGIGMQLNRVST